MQYEIGNPGNPELEWHLLECRIRIRAFNLHSSLLLFAASQNETEKSFQVRAIGDGIPELFESYVVRLVNAEGGGRIVDPREARIAIQASDDPSGVIGFDDYPGGIIIDEGNQLVFK